MSESKRKIFTGTQKAKVALAAVKGVKTINEIAQEYGVQPTPRVTQIGCTPRSGSST